MTTSLRMRSTAALAALVGAAIVGASAHASATPVGPLPKGPVIAVKLHVGKRYVVRLPKSAAPGHVWRVARAFDGRVVSEVGEGETSTAIVVTFQARHAGTTKVVFAETRGETAHAYAARSFRFLVTA